MEKLSLIVALALSVVALVAVALAWRATARQRGVIESIQGDMRALVNAAVAMGERVNQLERRLRDLAQRQDELGNRQEQIKQQEEPEDRSYAQAIKLARKGASADDLMEVCGLARGEAELVIMMHRLDPP